MKSRFANRNMKQSGSGAVAEEFEVHITDEGRSGSVEYREGGLSLLLWWEFTMDGAWIWAPDSSQWDEHWRARGVMGAVGRRNEILERVASETKRKRAESARTEVCSDGVHLKF